MKIIRITLLVLLTIINSIVVTSCWNYREVDELSIVAGVAVDKGTNGLYKITAEIIKISGGKDTKTMAKTITMEGRTMFDAVRNGISLSGKKLYWSHTKVIILSKEIASEGIIKVIDWYSRDSETRADVHILISEGKSAGEIFSGQGVTEEIKSFVLDDMLKNQESMSKAPVTDILKFNNDLKAEGICAIAPVVNLKQMDGIMLPNIMGTAIFKSDKLVGFLNGEETKNMIFVRNEIKGGVLIEGMQGNDLTIPVSLEIFKNKTQVTPVTNGKDIEINININTIAAIDEIEGTENLIDDEGRKKLEQNAEKMLKAQIESIINKMQSEYDADIFGFGAKLREDKIKVWYRVNNNWEETFKDLKVNVIAKVHIRNSSMLSKPLKVRE
jgi:spore germination protein KC